MIANQEGYVNTYRTAIQGAATGLYNFVTGTGLYNLQGLFATGFHDLFVGNPNGTFGALGSIYFTGVLSLLQPLEGAIGVPIDEAKNFSNLVAEAFSFGGPVESLALNVLGLPTNIFGVLGNSSQAFVNAVGDGNLLGALTAVLDTPADLTNALLNSFTNGFGSGTYLGILAPNELMTMLLVTAPQALATSIGW